MACANTSHRAHRTRAAEAWQCRRNTPRAQGGTGHHRGLRDWPSLPLWGYTFRRVSAVIGAKRGDYRQEGKRAGPGLLEKGNKGNKEKLSGCTVRRRSCWTLTSPLQASRIDSKGLGVCYTSKKFRPDLTARLRCVGVCASYGGTNGIIARCRPRRLIGEKQLVMDFSSMLLAANQK